MFRRAFSVSHSGRFQGLAFELESGHLRELRVDLCLERDRLSAATPSLSCHVSRVFSNALLRRICAVSLGILGLTFSDASFVGFVEGSFEADRRARSATALGWPVFEDRAAGDDAGTATLLRSAVRLPGALLRGAFDASVATFLDFVVEGVSSVAFGFTAEAISTVMESSDTSKSSSYVSDSMAPSHASRVLCVRASLGVTRFGLSERI